MSLKIGGRGSKPVAVPASRYSFRKSSGTLAIFAAIRRASLRSSNSAIVAAPDRRLIRVSAHRAVQPNK
jgi:hypothetical protein